jgi:RNA polymerase sigma factor (sigma-70 family)
MVLSVCRRHLRDTHAAEDAFQATFLVLARKAASVKWRESIGGWLFEVATRVSKKAAIQAARRQTRETAPNSTTPEPAAPVQNATADLTSLQKTLDDELRKLPEKLRTPVVLCHLEGLSQDEVAKHLGISDGQLRGRLYRAKERLRERLLRRGFTLTAVLLALSMTGKAQAVPAVLATSTLRLTTSAPNLIPVAVQQLALGVIHDMTTTFKTLALFALVGILGIATAGYAIRSTLNEQSQVAENTATQPQPAPRPNVQIAVPKAPATAQQPVRADDDDKKKDDKFQRVSCTIKSIDTAKSSLRVKLDEGGEETTIDLDAKLIGMNKLNVSFAGKPIKLDDLKAGMRANLVYPPENVAQGPHAIEAAWPRQEVQVKLVNAEQSTLTFELPGNGGVNFPVTTSVSKDVKVTVDGLNAGLADVIAGRRTELSLGLDRTTVIAINATGENGDIPVMIKSYDAAANTLLVEFEAEANDFSRRVTLCLAVNANAKVRLAGSDAKLTDLKDRMPARLRMTADRKGVAGILAGNPLPVPKDDDDK